MKKIGFLGDSITEGAGASDPAHVYSTVCCRLLGAEEYNYGLSGTRIARQRVADRACDPDEDYLLRARWMPKDLDFIFIFGGTNDFGHGDAELGQLGDKTPWTFYGAVYCLCQFFLENRGYSKDKLAFILPTPRFDQDSDNGDGQKDNRHKWPHLSAYIKAIQEVVPLFGIDAIELQGFEKPLTKPSALTIDGLHPNDKGHQMIGEQLAAYLKKKGF